MSFLSDYFLTLKCLDLGFRVRVIRVPLTFQFFQSFFLVSVIKLHVIISDVIFQILIPRACENREYTGLSM